MKRKHKWPFYLKISQHAFHRAHQRIPEFTNTQHMLEKIMPAVDMDKFNKAIYGVHKISTPDFIYIINKYGDDQAVLVTVIPRKTMTLKNKVDYTRMNDVGKDLTKQINEHIVRKMRT